MSDVLDRPERFSFQSRPIPVPGDLRIEWRVSLIVLMLGYSRAKQASLPKLHILNDAIRSSRERAQLDLIVGGKAGMLPWALRIEPAFARAVDFVVGDKLASWTASAGRSGLKLTASGAALFDKLKVQSDALVQERALLEIYAKAITEGAVDAVIGLKRGRE